MKQLNLLDLKTKKCSKCGEIKPISEFDKIYKDSEKRRSQCKECDKEWVKNNPKKRKKIEKKYRQKNIEKHTKEYYQNLSGTKRCGKCKEVKSKSEFSEDKRTKDGLYCWCKECEKKYKKEWRKNNPGYDTKRSKELRKKNPEKVREYQRKWRKNNLEKAKQNCRKSCRKWRSIPKNKLSNNISRLIRYSLKGNKKGNHWEDLVGFTLQELMAHLESLFKEGMNWGNIGEWHIDHIKPVSSFSFNSYNDPEFKQCWALKNLQPLWESENLSKGANFKV